MGVCHVNIKSQFCSVQAPVYVLKSSKQNLLGLQELSKLNLLTFKNALDANDFDSIRFYPRVFEGQDRMPGMNTINIQKDVSQDSNECVQDGSSFLKMTKRVCFADSGNVQPATKFSRSGSTVVNDSTAVTNAAPAVAKGDTGLSLFSKVDSFLHDVMNCVKQSDYVITASRLSFRQRRARIEQEYRRQLRQVDEEEAELERQVAGEAAMRDAIATLAALQNVASNPGKRITQYSTIAQGEVMVETESVSVVADVHTCVANVTTTSVVVPAVTTAAVAPMVSGDVTPVERGQVPAPRAETSAPVTRTDWSEEMELVDPSGLAQFEVPPVGDQVLEVRTNADSVGCSTGSGAQANVPLECDRELGYEYVYGHDSDALLEGGGGSEEDMDEDGEAMRSLFDESHS